jgi:hypothetical protein
MNQKLRTWLKVDALNRAWRTVLQGIVTAALAAGGDAVLQAIQGGNFDWHQVVKLAAGAAGTAAVMAILAYLHRTQLDPSVIPSALPPGAPGWPTPVATAPPAL